MTERIRDSNGRERVRRPHDGRSYDEHQITRVRWPFRSRCRACDRDFETTDGLAIECPTCLETRTRAERQTADMAFDAGERWRWSRAAMRDRLGVIGDRDE